MTPGSRAGRFPTWIVVTTLAGIALGVVVFVGVQRAWHRQSEGPRGKQAQVPLPARPLPRAVQPAPAPSPEPSPEPTPQPPRHRHPQPAEPAEPEPGEPPMPQASEAPVLASEPPSPPAPVPVIEVTVGGDTITVRAQAPGPGPRFKGSNGSLRPPPDFLSLLAGKSLTLEVAIDEQGRATMLDAVELPAVSKSLQGWLRGQARNFVASSIWEAARDVAGERSASTARLRITFK